MNLVLSVFTLNCIPTIAVYTIIIIYYGIPHIYVIRNTVIKILWAASNPRIVVGNKTVEKKHNNFRLFVFKIASQLAPRVCL